MWDDNACNCNFRGYDEEYKGYIIEIENNPDSYRGGYVWSIGDDEGYFEEDLNFTLNVCLNDARKAVDERIEKEVLQ